METDELLVRRAKTGDQQAFAVLVNRYQNKVYGTAYRILGDRDDALEASQEVFLKVWTRLGSLKEGSYFRTWLYRVTVNYALDQVRKHKHKDVPMQESVIEFLSVDSLRRPVTPRQASIQAELREEIRIAMRTLAPRQRTVFVLRHFQNLKMVEIAEVLEISVGTVKATLHTTLGKLRKALVEKKRQIPRRKEGEQ